ncbi:hypothetical protein HPB52_012109 [Rhipicephalus sanguineus]|uniref:Uncharacterized protein n=1 Tax=Rhipicephalus sanguineus TaxID=34632 RepID=A0A9D4T3M4_RHISA|nr:hypothetical protein HPB52_012109 [Rhipicephalus sanguineus]
MTEADLDGVCKTLSEMSVEEVRSLKEANIWWLPDIASLSKPEAISSIRNAMLSLDSTASRASSVAWLYCYLAEKNHMNSWRAYFLNESELSGKFTLHQRLMSALAYPGVSTTYENVEREDAVYVGILSTYADTSSPDHDVICLCIPRTLPYVFVHCSRNRNRIRVILGGVLRRPSLWFRDFRHLREAFDYARAK